MKYLRARILSIEVVLEDLSEEFKRIKEKQNKMASAEKIKIFQYDDFFTEQILYILSGIVACAAALINLGLAVAKFF